MFQEFSSAHAGFEGCSRNHRPCSQARSQGPLSSLRNASAWYASASSCTNDHSPDLYVKSYPRSSLRAQFPATPRSTRRYHDGSTRTRSGTLSTRRYHHGSTKINTTLSPRGYNFEGGRLGCHIYTCSRVRPGANQRFWLPPVTFPKPTPVLSGDACLFTNKLVGETPVDHFSQPVAATSTIIITASQHH